MTQEQILQMKKDLENLEKVRKKAGDIQEVTKHIGAIEQRTLSIDFYGKDILIKICIQCTYNCSTIVA